MQFKFKFKFPSCNFKFTQICFYKPFQKPRNSGIPKVLVEMGQQWKNRSSRKTARNGFYRDTSDGTPPQSLRAVGRQAHKR